LHNIKHNKIMHEQVVLLTILAEEKPHLQEDERYVWRELGNNIYRLIVRFGFMEDPNIPELLARVKGVPVSFDPMRTSYFLGRENLVATRTPGMAMWRERLFASMNRNATSAVHFFCLPPNQVIELGATIEI
jgi:KUP system potassium uptake protein